MKKGQIISRIMPAVLVPIVLIVMLAVYTNFETAIDRTDWSTTANDTFDDVNTQSYNAFDLASILPIVVIGVALLAILVGAFVFRGA